MTRRSGFTLIELVITFVVAGLILAIVGRALGNVQRRLAADQGMKTFEALHARTRAHAVERGGASLVVDVAGDSASVVQNGNVLETIYFQSELGVDLRSEAANPMVICMNSRGYGDESCMSFNTTVTLGFVAGDNTESVEILPLGQIKR